MPERTFAREGASRRKVPFHGKVGWAARTMSRDRGGVCRKVNAAGGAGKHWQGLPEGRAYLTHQEHALRCRGRS